MKKIFLLIALTALYISTFAQFGGGSGTEEDPYRIYTKEHFEEFATENNSMNYEMYGDFSGIHLRLMNNITDTVKIMPSSNPNSDFNGSFHGGGYSINIFPNSTIFQTVFNSIGTNGYIDSLKIVGTPYHFSSLVYTNYGTISHCICDVTIIHPIAQADYRSGIANTNYGIIEHCVNLTNFTNAILPEINYWDCTVFSGICYMNVGIIKYCKNKGNVSSKEALSAGIAIYNIDNGIIEMCINSGDNQALSVDPINVMTGGIACTTEGNAIIRNCVNTGNIVFSSIFPAGGIVYGASGNVNIINCLNLGNISGYCVDNNNERGAGIIGSSNDNTANIAYCLNLNKAGASAIVDTLLNFVSINATNNYYDKQTCLSKGINNEDISGSAEGKLTTQLTGTSPELQAMLGDGWSYAEGRYPIPLGLENDSMALVAATPVYLHFENEEDYNHVDSVSKNFTVGLENNVSWEEAFGRVSFNDENVQLLSIGYEILSVKLGNYSKKINIIIVDTEVSSPEILSNNEISIYPNPASEYLNIELNQHLSDEVQIYDISGKLLISKAINSNQTQINIADLEQGMYILNVLKSDRKIASLRFVKE
ncbi:MAG: T9SS type A sorting domain-containing protein [Bacteroidales bacterium]|nr:T9SS type A sorting domain-containing protein [Bacteroidales bacterium]